MFGTRFHNRQRAGEECRWTNEINHACFKETLEGIEPTWNCFAGSRPAIRHQRQLA
jgi:hypothetical protein